MKKIKRAKSKRITIKRGRRKTGQQRFSKSFSLDKRQVEWLDAYQGDSSELIRPLLDDYIDASVSAQPEALKLVLRLRMLKRQQEKIGVELDYDIGGSAYRNLVFAKADYERWRDKKGREEDEAQKISESTPEAYQRELERRKRVFDVAEASYQAFKGNYDALEKQIAEIEAQLLNLKK
jgi:hypothetical protein